MYFVMKTFIAVTVALFFCGVTFAQKISGVILNEKKNPIAFANILSSGGKGTVADQNGTFFI